MYLESVAEHDLLTAEDEVRLSRAMEVGRKAQHRLDSGTKLTPTERARLYHDAHEADEARRSSSGPTFASSSRSPSGTPGADSTCSTSSRRATWG